MIPGGKLVLEFVGAVFEDSEALLGVSAIAQRSIWL